MTITLTTQELFTFQQNLQRWYHERSVYIIKKGMEYVRSPYDPLAEPRRVKLDLDYEMAEWDKQHPKPDWQSLLAEVAAS